MNLKKIRLLKKKTKRPKPSKASITLIELMLTIALLLIVIGGLGFNVRSALLESRFRSESSSLFAKIDLCKKISSLFRSDLALKLEPNPAGGFKGKILILSPLPEAIEKALTKDLLYPSILSMRVDNEPKEEVVFLFSSRGESSIPTLRVARKGKSAERLGDESLREDEILDLYPAEVKK